MIPAVVVALVLMVWHHVREQRLRREFRWALAELEEHLGEDVRDQVLGDIELRRAERARTDAELCAWLLKWREGTRDQITEANRILGEFKEALEELSKDHGLDN